MERALAEMQSNVSAMDAIKQNRCRPLRGLDLFIVIVPGVPLRSTPGFTLPPAPRVEMVAELILLEVTK